MNKNMLLNNSHLIERIQQNVINFLNNTAAF